jgi:hypothetical protein
LLAHAKATKSKRDCCQEFDRFALRGLVHG